MGNSYYIRIDTMAYCTNNNYIYDRFSSNRVISIIYSFHPKTNKNIKR